MQVLNNYELAKIFHLLMFLSKSFFEFNIVSNLCHKDIRISIILLIINIHL
jgi:hypothetical protein